jgi:hypothetical protein
VGDALAPRTTEERYDASVRLIRPVEAARARPSSQAGYFAPPAAPMNASRSVTSFTSITTSDNGRDKHSKGPFVHVIHGPAAPAHKGVNPQRRPLPRPALRAPRVCRARPDRSSLARKGGSAPATECGFPGLATPTQLGLQRSRARRELRARYRVEARAEPHTPAPRSPLRAALFLARERFAEKRASGSRPCRVARRSRYRPDGLSISLRCGACAPPDQTLRGMAATVHGWPGGLCRHARRVWDDHVSRLRPARFRTQRSGHGAT